MGAAAQICPRFHRAAELIGKRWTGAIVRVLLDGPKRFTDLLAAVPRLHEPLLAERLRELEREGIVVRRVYGEMPVRIEYALTAKGRSLEKVMAEIQRWAERWMRPSPPQASPLHSLSADSPHQRMKAAATGPRGKAKPTVTD